MTLRKCPVCHSVAEEVESDNKNAGAIYCTECPVSVVDNRLTMSELRKVWNLMPRVRTPVINVSKFKKQYDKV